MGTPETSRLRRLTGLVRRCRRDRSGATALEYGILMMMVAVALLGMSALTNVANRQNSTFNTISDSLR